MKIKKPELKIPQYQPNKIEEKWQKIWERNAIYSPNLDTAKKPFYNLMMFPYPSAEGMHVGNMYAFTGADVYGRFMRMQGFDVFEPIGLDGFGIHSENYAIKVGRHPKEQAKVSEWNFYRQLHATGNGFDWIRRLETYDPKYYKWTQWLFIQLFKAGLAYRKKAPVSFCPSCKTVLADEQVIKKLKTTTQKSQLDEEIAVCERCGTGVEKRELEQWFLKITNYANRLLTNLAKLDWSEKVKIAQRQWIGKSEGARISFPVILRERSDREDPIGISRSARNDNQHKIEVFTTRHDTLYGATFLVLSPEHPIVASLLNSKFKIQNSKLDELKRYVDKAKKKTEQERIAEGKEKTGIFSGLYGINPVNNEKIPIWIADYVLMGYGTGAIMAVPGHDSRDYEFAKHYKLTIKNVIARSETTKQSQSAKIATLPSVARNDKKEVEVYTGEGTIVNSNKWNGWKTPQDVGKVITWLENKGLGEREVTYHLRDWLISRQRYWGPPIPMIYCKRCKWQPVPEDGLPVLLPDVKNWKPTGTGKSPLASVESFVNATCPNCKGKAKRETDVSDTFLDSAWYFFRYTSNDIESSAFDIKRVKKWLPVAIYIGGAEHSVLHLLYSRFITMALYDLGFISFEEPFSRFYAHGLLIKEGAKMSKSKGNVVTPDEYIKKYGADTLRCYLMFLGPFDGGGDFYDTGVEGMHRFIKRLWRLINQFPISNFQFPISDERRKFMNKTIKKVTEDIEALRYNTAIAAMMEWYNYLNLELRTKNSELTKEEAETFLKLLAPFAPHVTEELYHNVILSVSEGSLANASPVSVGDSSSVSRQTQNNIKDISIHAQPWPKFDPKFLEESKTTIVVQVNGKVRDTIIIQNSEFRIQNLIEKKAKQSERVKKYIEGKLIKKVVYVEGKVINFVTE
ncbi:MAG: leucine--tRNA ligase [Patescibacteria group bacterium]